MTAFMKKLFAILAAALVCASASAQGWMELIKGVFIDETNYAGMEAIMTEIKAILKEQQEEQMRESGMSDAGSFDRDVLERTTEFYAEIEKEAVDRLTWLYEQAQAVKKNGGEADFWAQKAADFIHVYRTGGNIPGTDKSLREVTQYMKMRGVSKDQKLKYLDDIMHQMKSNYASDTLKEMEEYYFNQSVEKVKKSEEDLQDFISGGRSQEERDREAREKAEEAADELEGQTGTVGTILCILVIGMAAAVLGWNIRRYFQGKAESEEVFIRCGIAVAVAFVIIMVIL